VDASGELATLYAQLCNHPAALKEYREAIHRLRVSEGLLTPAQLPYLRAQAESYRAIGDFESAQKTWRYAFRIHAMGQGDPDAAAMRDSLGYFAFARSVFIDPRASADKALFYEAYRDTEAMLKAQRERGALAFIDLRSLGLSHLANLYLLMGTDLSGAQLSESAMASASAMLRLQDIAYGRGVDVLEWLTTLAPDDSTRADLALRLGNWHQWNGYWRRSCEAYERAWSLAAEGATLRRRLWEAADLPEDPALWASLQAPDVPVLAQIVADFSVSRRGDVSRVQARVEGDASSALAGRVARWLRDSHVRPAIRDGVCSASEVKGRRYRLLP
jgi:hypothetical protein